MQSSPEQLLTVRELAILLNATERTVYNMILSKEIPFIRLGDGGDYRFDRNSVKEALSHNMKQK